MNKTQPKTYIGPHIKYRFLLRFSRNMNFLEKLFINIQKQNFMKNHSVGAKSSMWKQLERHDKDSSCFLQFSGVFFLKQIKRILYVIHIYIYIYIHIYICERLFMLQVLLHRYNLSYVPNE
jgi:hypothetical protein